MQRQRSAIVLMTILLLSFLAALPALAQVTPPPTPNPIGQNLPGSISSQTPVLIYALTSASPQSVQIQVLGLTQGFSPTFIVLGPNGLPIQAVANPTNTSSLQATVNLLDVGIYAIQVQSANGSAGDFVLGVQNGRPLLPPVPLQPGQSLSGTVDPVQISLLSYSFTGLPDQGLYLTVISGLPNTPPPIVGPVITLRDSLTNETLGTASSRLIGVRFRIPLGINNYIAQIAHSGSAFSEPFTICLETESGTLTCNGAGAAIATVTPIPTALPPGAPSPTPFVPVQIPPGAVCQVASAEGNNINLRSAPSTSAAILGQMLPSQTAFVIGRLSDNSWYQVNLNGTLGWMASSVVIIGGNCAGVPVVAPPTAPPPAATFTPSPTGTPLVVTATPTATYTATPGPSPTPGFIFPIITFEPTFFIPIITLSP
jgi:hypothetical protein